MVQAARLAHSTGLPLIPLIPRGRGAMAITLGLGLATWPGAAIAQEPGTTQEPATVQERGIEPEAPQELPATDPLEEPAKIAEDGSGPGPSAAEDLEDPAETSEAIGEESEPEVDDEVVPPPAVVEPLRTLQTAAWWTMFGAFAVGTTAGVLSGLAERQEDRATRLSTLFDSETGAQPLYADRQEEYEDYLRRGDAFAKAAIGVGVVAGVATITAITLFVIDARGQRADRGPREGRRARFRWRLSGMEVRF